MTHFLRVPLCLLALTTACLAQGEPMSVQDELNALSEKFKAMAPPEVIETFEKNIDTLAESPIMQGALDEGDTAPDFTLPDTDGKPVKLSELLADGPVVLTWYRGGWCPYCNVGLKALARHHDEITAAGGNVIAISPQKPEHSAATRQSGELPFAVVSDEGNKVAAKYGLVFPLSEEMKVLYRERIDLPAYNGDESWTLPLAATYVVDTDGVIRWAFVEADYRKRAEPAAIVEAVQSLKD